MSEARLMHDDNERWRSVSRTNVGRLERWASMVAGGALAAYGLRRRQMPGGAAALAGAALLYRGATGHCPLYGAAGINTTGAGHTVAADRGSDTREQLGGSRGIHVEESVTINRPVSKVYGSGAISRIYPGS